jgi:hypothetical protein
MLEENGEDNAFNFKRKTSNLDQDSNFRPPNLYHLSYPGSIDGAGLNLPPESLAMQGVLVCDTICHQLTDKIVRENNLMKKFLNV